MRALHAIDADGHVTEDRVDWAARLPEQFRDRAPTTVPDEHGRRQWLIDGYYFPNSLYEGKGRWATMPLEARSRANPAGMRDPRARLPDMDEEGIDLAVLYGTGFAFFATATDDWRFSQALCRAWNDWAAEYCAAEPARLKFAALVPLGEARAAAEETERAVRELGSVGLTFPPTYAGRSLDQTYFDPIYEAAQRLDVPICVHANNGAGKYCEALGRHDNWLITHALSMPMGLCHALASVVCGGVLERFPTLRVAFLEGGVGWLPFFMDRLDEHVEKLPSLAPWLTRSPSEHIRGGRVFLTCEPEEDLQYALSRLGDGVIMYASDYAHWDSEFPESARKIADRDELTATQKARILRDNALRFYGLPVPATV
ncbi:MAG TPA: amidohydrolase family protein [Chloroflexota bacterium]|nr:amidohydrolase family protein [Chloroflexota bacterium]